LIIRLDHWWSSRSDLDKETVGKKLETYLKDNGFRYLVVGQDTYMDGILISVEDIGKYDFPGRTEEIRKISDFACFLFDELQLQKNCLHFVIGRNMINGEGQPEGSFHALDETVFNELTGKFLPKKFGPKTIDEFKDWMDDQGVS